MRALIAGRNGKRLPAVGAFVGLVAGLAISGLLVGMALFKNSPGGPNENRMWFGLFANLLGMPLAALRDGLMPSQSRGLAVVVTTLLLNWLVLGFLVGSAVKFLRHAKETRDKPERA